MFSIILELVYFIRIPDPVLFFVVTLALGS